MTEFYYVQRLSVTRAILKDILMVELEAVTPGYFRILASLVHIKKFLGTVIVSVLIGTRFTAANPKSRRTSKMDVTTITSMIRCHGSTKASPCSPLSSSRPHCIPRGPRRVEDRPHNSVNGWDGFLDAPWKLDRRTPITDAQSQSLLNGVHKISWD